MGCKSLGTCRQPRAEKSAATYDMRLRVKVEINPPENQSPNGQDESASNYPLIMSYRCMSAWDAWGNIRLPRLLRKSPHPHDMARGKRRDVGLSGLRLRS